MTLAKIAAGGSGDKKPFFMGACFYAAKKTRNSGSRMFVLRSLFWLMTLVMLLPPAGDGGPAPRVSVLHVAYSARILLQDVTGVCERNPDACAASRAAMALMMQKLETGADIVAAGLATARPGDDADHGTLRAEDLEPAWALAENSN